MQESNGNQSEVTPTPEVDPTPVDATRSITDEPTVVYLNREQRRKLWRMQRKGKPTMYDHLVILTKEPR